MTQQASETLQDITGFSQGDHVNISFDMESGSTDVVATGYYIGQNQRTGDLLIGIRVVLNAAATGWQTRKVVNLPPDQVMKLELYSDSK